MWDKVRGRTLDDVCECGTKIFARALQGQRTNFCGVGAPRVNDAVEVALVFVGRPTDARPASRDTLYVLSSCHNIEGATYVRRCTFIICSQIS